ncbi:MAG: glutamate 5-kinase, partial [Selenomonadaceae bacterium]|nr:glutamate 5-kinase [Selenomonadaceae bacterium]
TKENAVDEEARANSRNSLSTILSMGAIPVINENDAVGVDEIRIGDNDNLSAIVAAMINAEVLIILSDIDGLYTGNPNVDKSARLIDEVAEIDSEIERIAGGAGTKLGIGGMFTKIQAAKLATSNGVTMLIVNGSTNGNLRRALSGESIGTIFPRRVRHD